MVFWTAFLLGFVGSAHCAGMCGPLALALPGADAARSRFLTGRLLYNLGRLVTYSAMGALFGLLGQGFALAGLQRWVSLTLGAVILLVLLVSPRFLAAVPMLNAVGWMKTALGRLFRLSTPGALFGIGLLNGLLPCGLVYAAFAPATVAGSVVGGAGVMAAFGLGTLPMMLAVSLLGQKLQFQLRFRLQRLIPVSLAIVGVLLILRGMALGIPYLSPDLAGQGGRCHH